MMGERAVINDERMKRGLPPQEAEDNEKVLVWPDLVYTELICMVVLTAILLFWAIGVGFASSAAIAVAAFSHAYIWVHFYATERPDMQFLYEPRDA